MKNWLLALFGFGVRAIEAVPRTCGSSLNSALRLGWSEPLVPVPVGSPPCAMKPGITRWNTHTVVKAAVGELGDALRRGRARGRAEA